MVGDGDVVVGDVVGDVVVGDDVVVSDVVVGDGVVIGDALGGSVGFEVAHVPLSHPHASLLQAGSQWLSCTMYGKHPGAHSMVD